jgi:hypothetical protein
MLHPGMGVVLINNTWNGINHNKRGQNAVAYFDDRFEPVAKEIDKFDNHPITALTKFIINPGKIPISTEIKAAIPSSVFLTPGFISLGSSF